MVEHLHLTDVAVSEQPLALGLNIEHPNRIQKDCGNSVELPLDYLLLIEDMTLAVQQPPDPILRIEHIHPLKLLTIGL